jgi:hypothetical protein
MAPGTVVLLQSPSLLCRLMTSPHFEPYTFSKIWKFKDTGILQPISSVNMNMNIKNLLSRQRVSNWNDLKD